MKGENVTTEIQPTDKEMLDEAIRLLVRTCIKKGPHIFGLHCHKNLKYNTAVEEKAVISGCRKCMRNYLKLETIESMKD